MTTENTMRWENTDVTDGDSQGLLCPNTCALDMYILCSKHLHSSQVTEAVSKQF